MSEVSIYENWTEIFNRKLDSLMSTNEKIINFCEKNAEEINYLHKKIDELSGNKSVKEPKLLFDNPITEEDLLLNINNGIFNPRLEGREVILKEGENDAHIWIIIRVNSNSYDLWYNGSIGEARWKGIHSDRYWGNNNPIDTFYVRGACNQYKSKLSYPIRYRLKSGLNTNCGSDLVVILSAKQLGYTGTDCLNDDNIPISYFNSDSRRRIGYNYWTSSVYYSSLRSSDLFYVMIDGAFNFDDYCRHDIGVVPAIRVGI